MEGWMFFATKGIAFCALTISGIMLYLLYWKREAPFRTLRLSMALVFFLVSLHFILPDSKDWWYIVIHYFTFLASLYTAIFLYISLPKLLQQPTLGQWKDINDEKNWQIQKFEAAMSVMSNGLIMSNSEGRITYVNPAFTKLFGWTAVEAIGSPLVLIIPPRLRQLHKEGFERFLRTQESRLLGKPVQMFGLHAEGHEFPVELTLDNMVDPFGNPKFIALIRDVSVNRASQAVVDKMEEVKNFPAEEAMAELLATIENLRQYAHAPEGG